MILCVGHVRAPILGRPQRQLQSGLAASHLFRPLDYQPDCTPRPFANESLCIFGEGSIDYLDVHSKSARRIVSPYPHPFFRVPLCPQFFGRFSVARFEMFRPFPSLVRSAAGGQW